MHLSGKCKRLQAAAKRDVMSPPSQAKAVVLSCPMPCCQNDELLATSAHEEVLLLSVS